VEAYQIYKYDLHKKGNRQAFYYSEWHSIPLTEEWLLKNTDAEDWGIFEVNEFEKYKRYVFHNAVDGTSNYEVHFIKSTYGQFPHHEIVFSIDNDERQRIEKTESVHNLQNSFYLATGYDFEMKKN